MRKLFILLFASIVLIVPIHAQDGEPTDTPDPIDGVLLVLTVEDNVTLVEDDLVAVRDILADRIIAAGYTDFSVQALPPGEFLIALEGESDINLTETFFAFLTDPGFVEFVNFAGVPNDVVQDLLGTTIVTSAQVERFSGDNPPEAEFGTILTGDRITAAFARPPSGGGGLESVLDLLSGETGAATTPSRDDTAETSDWTLEFELDEEGAELLYGYTSSNIGLPIAIVINGEVITAPIVQSPLSNGGVISGLTRTEAITLAEQLRSGVLPAALTVETATFYSEVRFQSRLSGE